MNPSRTAAAARLLVAILLFITAGVHATEPYRHAPLPEWSDPLPLPDAGPADAGAGGITWLLADIQVALDREPIEQQVHTAYRVDARTGVEPGGRFEINFQPEYQQVLLHSVTLIRDTRLLDRTPDLRADLLRRERGLESGIIDGEHTLSVLIPDVRVGDVIDYQYSIVGFNPVFDGGFHGEFGAAFGTPLAQRRVRLRYPDSLAVQWQVDHPDYVETQSTAGRIRTVELVAQDLSAVDAEADAPSWYDPYGSIRVSTARSWSDVAAWAARRFPTRFTERAVADAIADELQLHVGGPLQAMERATAFVQGDVRYTGLQLGQWTHAAYPPELTLQRRFGDCKAKASLLVALLTEAGIKARPVLVNTESRHMLQQHLPSAYAFDHVVVQASIDDQDYWIDATRSREHGAFAQRTPLAFRLGLPVASAADELIEIPLPAPVLPDVDVEQTVDVSTQEGQLIADFTVTTAYAGGKAEQIADEFVSSGAESIGDSYLEYMQRFYPDMQQLQVPEMGERDEHGRLHVVERYRWPVPVEDASQMSIRLFQLADWMPADIAERTAPIALTGARHGKQTIRVGTEGGWSIDPESDSVQTEHFRFDRNVSVEEGQLVIRGEWQRFTDAIPVEQLKQANTELDRAWNLIDFSVDFDAGASALREPGNWAWPGASLLLVLLVSVVAWVNRQQLAFGMFFRPTPTSDRLLLHSAAQPVGLALLGLLALVSLAFEQGAESAAAGEAAAVGGLMLGFLTQLLHALLAAVPVWLGFRLMRRNAAYAKLLMAYGWSMLPVLALMACALVAVRGRIELFADGHEPKPEDTPALIVAGAIVFIGLAWSGWSMITAYSRVAGSSRRRALAALLLGASLFLVPALLIAFSAHLQP